MANFDLKRSIDAFTEILCRGISSPKVRREIAQEYAEHIEDEVYNLTLGGMSEEEAFCVACENLGPTENYRELLEDVHNVPELLPEEIEMLRAERLKKAVGIAGSLAVIIALSFIFRWIIIEAIAVVLVIYLVCTIPSLIRVLVKRLALVHKLKKVCRQRGFCLTPTHFLWWLGWTKGKRCDFYIEIYDKIVSVKLIGVISRIVHFRYVNSSEYKLRSLRFLTRYHIASLMSVDERKHQFISKRKSPYDFRYKFPDADKEMIPVILMNPVSSDVSVSLKKDDRLQIADGEFLDEGYFFSGHGFVNMLHEIK